MGFLDGSISTFPNEIDKIREVFDISPSRKADALRFQQLKVKENLTPDEIQELNNLTILLEDFLITPTLFNTFGSAVVALEKFFLEETVGFIEEMKQDVQVEIDKFQHRGTYNNSTQYFQRNTVDYNDGTGIKVYIALQNTLGNVPTNNTFWKLLTIQGQTGQRGQSGVGVIPKGQWNSSTMYGKDEGAYCDGAFFASAMDNNVGNRPLLGQDTPEWFQVSDTAISTTKLRGQRTIGSSSSAVNFITGEINVFNKNTDDLEVFANSVALEEGIDYNINPDNQSITRTNGTWEAGTIFYFRTTRWQINNLLFTDGQSIAEGTITRNKLDVDTQAEIGKVSGIEKSVGNPNDLTTVNKDNLVSALNEVKSETDSHLAQKAHYPVSQPSSFQGSPDDKKTIISWKNPDDFKVLDISGNVKTLAEFDKVELKRDNVVVYEGNLETFTNTGLNNYQEYTYEITSITKAGVKSEPITIKVTPAPYTMDWGYGVTDLSAQSADTQVTLTWTNPAQMDLQGVIVRASNVAYPTTIKEGTLVYNGAGTTVTETGLTNDVPRFYTVWAYSNTNQYSTNQYSDDANKKQITASASAFKIYGVKIDTTNSNPETAVTYTDDAVGFTPAFCNNGNWQMGSWENKFPYDQIKPCLFKNGVVNYYLNPNDYTKKLDGSVADITSGNDGDVMVEFPKIYWKFETIGTDLYVRYSDVQIDSGYKCLAHTVGTTIKDKIYISAYRGFSTGGKLRSLSGKLPTGSQTIGQFRTLAQSNGAGYQQMCYYPLLMLQVLAMIMGKNRDSQTQLGRGFVNSNNTSAISTGNTNTKGMFYGENTGELQNKFCGIEDFYGNQFLFIDGMYSDASWNMMISKQSTFNDTGSGYVNHGIGANSNLSGYIVRVQGGTETGFIIKTSSGSVTTHYSDYGDLYGGYLPAFGSAWAAAADAGAFYLRVHHAASYSGADYGAALCFLGN